jgi:formate hydrogenlyase subunit 6/NADH:ubiquinone oxidoreductase subunit I
MSQSTFLMNFGRIKKWLRRLVTFVKKMFEEVGTNISLRIKIVTGSEFAMYTLDDYKFCVYCMYISSRCNTICPASSNIHLPLDS